MPRGKGAAGNGRKWLGCEGWRSAGAGVNKGQLWPAYRVRMPQKYFEKMGYDGFTRRNGQCKRHVRIGRFTNGAHRRYPVPFFVYVVNLVVMMMMEML